MFLYIFTMMFSGGMIPTYLVVRQFQLVDKLGGPVHPPACLLPST
jgi:ABC-type glycerol-3-phosphate transport system permease component